MKRYTILSLFPDYFTSPLNQSMLKRGQDKGLVSFSLIDIRDYANNKHKQVDDRPYGGGPGMLMQAQPVIDAIRDARSCQSTVVYLSPQGEKLTPGLAKELSELEDVVILCGHYEGVDQRAIDLEVDRSVSIGDFVMTSGCPGALVLVDVVLRFVPGFLGKEASFRAESFEGQGGLEPPQYTRPSVVEGLGVPEVLLSGHHAKIRRYEEEESIKLTQKLRPDLQEKKQP